MKIVVAFLALVDTVAEKYPKVRRALMILAVAVMASSAIGLVPDPGSEPLKALKDWLEGLSVLAVK